MHKEKLKESRTKMNIKNIGIIMSLITWLAVPSMTLHAEEYIVPVDDSPIVNKEFAVDAKNVTEEMVDANTIDTSSFALLDKSMKMPRDKQSTIIEVKDEQAWKDAIKQVNAADYGEFTITLTSDISVSYRSGGASTTTSFAKNKTTILGNGHTITLTDYGHFGIMGDAVVNLGTSDGTDILTITQDTSYEVAILALGGTTNMYEGVRIFNCKPLSPSSMSSAVWIAPGPGGNFGTFHMYGGSIDSNTVEENFAFGGGAVIVETGCTFTMHGGVIENNKTLKTSVAMSGGVTLFGGTFYMEGGVIKNNISEKGTSRYSFASGGVALVPQGPSYFKMTGGFIIDNTGNNGGGIHNDGGIVEIKGGQITGNTAASGGGYYATGDATGTIENAVVANNKAMDAGADIALSDEATLKLLPAKDMNITYTGDTFHAQISGWYLDSKDQRWKVNESSAIDVTEELNNINLIGAYESYEVTYQFKSETKGKELPESVLKMLPEN